MKKLKLMICLVLILVCLWLVTSSVMYTPPKGEIGTAIFREKVNGVWVVTESD